MAVGWSDLGLVSVPLSDAFRTQRNRQVSETPSADCEGSHMPGPDVRVEPGTLRNGPSNERLVEFGAGNPHGTTDAVEFGQEERAPRLTEAGQTALECSDLAERCTLRNKATNLVDGDRQADYGEPVYMHAQVAQVWAATFGWDVDNHKAALAMALVKIVREAHKPKTDNRVDAVGYIEIAGRCAE